MANTINTRLVIRNADLSTWEKSETKLLKGEMAFAQLSGDQAGQYKVRIGVGDKTWNELSDQGQLIIPADNVEGLNAAIAALSTSYYETSALTDLTGTYVNGDIAVVTADIDGTHTSYTAYRYSTQVADWQALDGNYSADNVYMPDNMKISYTFGKYTASTASVRTLNCKGMTVKAFINDAFVDTVQPSITNPSFSLGGFSGLTGEVGTKYTVPGANLSFNRGSYTYGPSDTKVSCLAGVKLERVANGDVAAAEATTDAAKTQGQILTVPAFGTQQTFKSSTDTYTYKYTNGFYTDSPVQPLDNIGGTSTKAPIKANTNALTSQGTASFTGYYPCYYGQFASNVIANPETMTSSDVVSYSGSTVGTANGFEKTVNTNQRPADRTSFQSYTCKQWFWIAKKGTITSVYARQNNPAAPLGTVLKRATSLVLPTANGYGDTEYDVWYVNNDNAAANGYAWKLNGTF